MSAPAQPGSRASPGSLLVHAATIPLAHVKGEIGQLAVLEGTLFVAAVEAGRVEVVDLKAKSRIGSIEGLPRPRGVAAHSGWGGKRVAVVSCEGDSTVRWVDIGSRTELGRVTVDESAGRLLVPTLPAGMGYVMDGAGAEAGLSTIDTLNGKRREERLNLGGEVRGLVLANRGGLGSFMATHGYANAGGGVVRFALRPLKVETTWVLKGASENRAIAVGPIHHATNSHVENWRVFVGCGKPASVLVLDGTTGEQLGKVACGEGVGELFWVEGKLVAVCAGGSGSVEVFEKGEDFGPRRERWTRALRLTTGPGAGTGVVIPKTVGNTHRVVVAVPGRGDRGAEVRVYEVGW